eukprot:2077395-Rhodomonas_salina.1
MDPNKGKTLVHATVQGDYDIAVIRGEDGLPSSTKKKRKEERSRTTKFLTLNRRKFANMSHNHSRRNGGSRYPCCLLREETGDQGDDDNDLMCLCKGVVRYFRLSLAHEEPTVASQHEAY